MSALENVIAEALGQRRAEVNAPAAGSVDVEKYTVLARLDAAASASALRDALSPELLKDLGHECVRITSVGHTTETQ